MEPFTFIVFEKETLSEIIWDEQEIHHTILDIEEKKIWASCTLYTKEIRNTRKNSFDTRFKSLENISFEDIIYFHRGSGKEDLENGFLINRDNRVRTLSITNLTRNIDKIQLNHYDLINDSFKINELKNNQSS